jgi:hypothetical protein
MQFCCCYVCHTASEHTELLHLISKSLVFSREQNLSQPSNLLKNAEVIEISPSRYADATTAMMLLVISPRAQPRGEV